MIIWKSNNDVQEADMGVIGTRILVHHHRDYPADVWLLSGRGFLAGFDKVQLNSKDPEEAKKEALEKVQAILSRLLRGLAT